MSTAGPTSPTSPTPNPTFSTESTPKQSNCLVPTAGQLPPLQLSNSYSPKVSSASNTSGSAKSSGETSYISDNNNNSRSSIDLSNLPSEPSNDADDGDVSPNNNSSSSIDSNLRPELQNVADDDDVSQNNNPSSTSSSSTNDDDATIIKLAPTQQNTNSQFPVNNSILSLLPEFNSCPAINVFFNLLNKHLSPDDNINLRQNSINYVLANAYSCLISSEQQTENTANTNNAYSVQEIKYLLWNIIIQIESIKSNGIKRYNRACDINDSEVNTLLDTIYVKDKASFFLVINDKITDCIKSLCIKIEKRNVEQASESVAIDINTTDIRNPTIAQRNNQIVITYNPDKLREDKKPTTTKDMVIFVSNLILAILKITNSLAVVKFSVESSLGYLNQNQPVKISLTTLIACSTANGIICANSRGASILDNNPQKDIDIKKYSPRQKIGYYFCKIMAYLALATNFLTGVLGGKVFVDMLTPGWTDKIAEIIKTVISGILGIANAKAYQKFQLQDVLVNYNRLFGEDATKDATKKEPVSLLTKIKKGIAGFFTSLITLSFSAITFFQVVSTLETLIKNINEWSESNNNVSDYATLTTIISAILTLPLIVATILSQSMKTYDLIEKPLSVLPGKKEIASIKTWAGGLTFTGLFAAGVFDLLAYVFGQYAAGLVMAQRFGASINATWVKAAAWALVVIPRAVTSLSFDQANVWKMFYESKSPRMHRHIIITIPASPDPSTINAAYEDFNKNFSTDPTKPLNIFLTCELKLVKNKETNKDELKNIWYISGENGEGERINNQEIPEGSPLGKLLAGKNVSTINSIADKLLDPIMLHLNLIQTHNRFGGAIDKTFSKYSCCISKFLCCRGKPKHKRRQPLPTANSNPASSSSSSSTIPTPSDNTQLLPAKPTLTSPAIYNDDLAAQNNSLNGTDDIITVNMDGIASSIPAKPSKHCCCLSSSSMFSRKKKKHYQAAYAFADDNLSDDNAVKTTKSSQSKSDRCSIL